MHIEFPALGTRRTASPVFPLLASAACFPSFICTSYVRVFLGVTPIYVISCACHRILVFQTTPLILWLFLFFFFKFSRAWQHSNWNSWYVSSAPDVNLFSLSGSCFPAFDADVFLHMPLDAWSPDRASHVVISWHQNFPRLAIIVRFPRSRLVYLISLLIPVACFPAFGCMSNVLYCV